MLKKVMKMVIPLLLIFLIIGSISANNVNYTEINETVEHDIIIDEPPVINSTQKLINLENKTYNEVSVKNETISNTTYEEHTQKLIGYDTEYTHGGENYKGFEIDHIVLANGTIIKYDDEKNLAGCEPKPLNKYCNATLYLKNGTVLDIVIHNEGNKAYQNYGYRNVIPIYEDEVIIIEEVVNKVTTFVNHITEILYEVVNVPEPVPVPINNSVDINYTDIIVNYILNVDDINTNNTDIIINDTINDDGIVDGINMEKTGGLVNWLILAILLLVVGMIVYYKRK